jgi:7-carboxy-7-deazaguanine synthase
MAAAPTLRITEIFHSLQGETRTAGLPTVFVRLTGCPLRCGYCETAYAFSGGALRTLDEIVSAVRDWRPRYVTVTGGEPLAQPECLPLLVRLLDEPGVREVSLETSGALDVAAVDPRVVKVLDLKTPASGECHRNLWSNLEHLTGRDQIKFVVCDRADYEWARMQIDSRRLPDLVDEVLLSPSHGVVEPSDLAGWILEDGLDVRMQLQMHKYLWGDEPGH